MRRVPGILVAAMLAVSALAGCSTARSADTTATTLDLTASAATPTFVRNWNIFVPTSESTGPAPAFFSEPLVRVDYLHNDRVLPWLARSFTFSDQGRTLTFRLRDGVTFTDGTPLTAADVRYSLQVPLEHPSLTGQVPLAAGTTISAPDPHTVVVRYRQGSYHDLVNYVNRRIVPEHVWAGHDPRTWTNPNPVGTGAYTLSSYSPQRVLLKVRPHYWHGAFHGVRYVAVHAFGSQDAGQQMVLRDDVSWSTMTWQDARSTLERGATNHYWTYPTGGSEALVFNTRKAPTNDVHLRRALYAAIDPAKLLKLYDDGQQPANPTGLSNQVWRDYLAPELRDVQHTQDPTTARRELKAGGFRVVHGKLTRAGKTYPISLATVAEYTNWKAYATGMRQQWKQVLGLDVDVRTLSGTQAIAQEAAGDFTMTEDWVIGGTDIWAGLDSSLNSAYAPAGRKASNDYSGYRNARVNAMLAAMAASNDPAVLKRNAYAIERTVVSDVPFGPLHTSDWFLEVNASKWTGWPDPATTHHVPHTLLGPDTTLTIQQLRPVRR